MTSSSPGFCPKKAPWPTLLSEFIPVEFL
uniref:Uncharacterized protein n=1 Tax=Rhizophora mucronata TaxID=61149 RepID=A0A2P2Q518_RHIMU